MTAVDWDEVFTGLQTIAPRPAPVSGVVDDPGHGIAVLRADGMDGAVFTDHGAVLRLWSGKGVDLTPGQVRELVAALTGWADRRAAS